MPDLARRIALAALAALLLVAAHARADGPVLAPDAIVGIWETEHEDGNWSHVEIHAKDGKFHGQIVWLKNPLYDIGEVVGLDNHPRVDRQNPDEDLRSRPLLGLEIMTDLVHDGHNKWEDGRIYDPRSGKTYRCKATMKDDGTLEIFGYRKVGFVNIGKNATWTRVPAQQ